MGGKKSIKLQPQKVVANFPDIEKASLASKEENYSINQTESMRDSTSGVLQGNIREMFNLYDKFNWNKDVFLSSDEFKELIGRCAGEIFDVNEYEDKLKRDVDDEQKVLDKKLKDFYRNVIGNNSCDVDRLLDVIFRIKEEKHFNSQEAAKNFLDGELQTELDYLKKIKNKLKSENGCFLLEPEYAEWEKHKDSDMDVLCYQDRGLLSKANQNLRLESRGSLRKFKRDLKEALDNALKVAQILRDHYKDLKELCGAKENVEEAGRKRQKFIKVKSESQQPKRIKSRKVENNIKWRKW